MTFIVEDGTGLEDANALCSVEFVDEYLSDRGLDGNWSALSDTEKEQNIVQATDYLQLRYGTSWTGFKLVNTQALDFPRFGIYDLDDILLASDSVPTNLKKSVAEAIRHVIDNDDELFPHFETDDFGLSEESITIGQAIITTSRWNTSKSTSVTIPKVDSLLKSSGLIGTSIKRVDS